MKTRRSIERTAVDNPSEFPLFFLQALIYCFHREGPSRNRRRDRISLLAEQVVVPHAALTIVNQCRQTSRGLVKIPLPDLPALNYQMLERQDTFAKPAVRALKTVLLQFKNDWINHLRR